MNAVQILQKCSMINLYIITKLLLNMAYVTASTISKCQSKEKKLLKLIDTGKLLDRRWWRNKEQRTRRQIGRECLHCI